MSNKSDAKLISGFIKFCSAQNMTLEDMGAQVSMTKAWASLLVKGKIKQLKFATRNRIATYLGKHQ